MTSSRQEEQRKPPKGVCRASHPLLADVRCGRLTGHPGRHEAEASQGVNVTWGEPEEKTG